MPALAKFTRQLNIAISPAQLEALHALAAKERRNLSEMVRVLLWEALQVQRPCKVPPPAADCNRYEYEILLTPDRAAEFLAEGYQLEPYTKIKQLALPFKEF